MAETKKDETKMQEKDFPDADSEVAAKVDKDLEVVPTAEEAAAEMEKIVDEKEAKADEKEKVAIAKEMTYEERRRETPEQRYAREDREKLEAWIPKTELGREVRAGKIKKLDDVLDSGRKIMESEIVDSLVDLKVELLDIGQMKGKFGGGKRRAFKQTQKKTMEGNVLTFSVLAVVGDGKGHVGIGFGRAAETLPAKSKAIRKAKLNIERIRRGCASYDCSCDENHSIPLATEGKCSSVRVKLMPAPQGTGLVASDQLKKILRLVGITDIYSRSFGKSRTTANSAKACMAALRKLNEVKL